METWVKMLWVLFAGSAGAIVPVAIKEHLTRRQRLVCAGVGVLVAVFVAPAVSETLMSKDDYAIQGSIAFALGALGWKLAEIVLNVVDQHGGHLVDSLANRIISKQGEIKNDVD